MLDFYQVYNTNQVCSDISDQYSEIEDRIECRKAFAFAVRDFYQKNPRREVVHHVHEEYNNAQEPKGCFIKAIGSNNHVYFNTHPSGRRNDQSRPICKKSMICYTDRIARMRIYINV